MIGHDDDIHGQLMDDEPHDDEPTHHESPGNESPAHEAHAAGSTPPPPPSAPPSPSPGAGSGRSSVRRLTRSRDRRIAGVAGGLAEYFAIDPIIVRLAFVVALFAGGTGLVAYAIAWAVIPSDDGETLGRSVRHVDPTTMIALVVLGVGVWIGFADPFDGGFIAPLVLVGVGVYLLSQHQATARVRDLEPASPQTPPPTGAPLESPWRPIRDVTDAPEPAEPPPPRQPAVVTRLALSVLALLVAGSVVVDKAGWADVSATTVIAIALVVVGLAAVAGSIIGRSRGTVAIGIVLTLALAVTNVVEPVLDGGVGERRFRPLSAAAVEPTYELGIGELSVDLRAVQVPAGEVLEVSAELGIGEVDVLVPDDVGLIITGDLDAGRLRVLGLEEEGLGNEIRAAETVPGAGTLILDLDVGIGEATVRHG